MRLAPFMGCVIAWLALSLPAGAQPALDIDRADAATLAASLPGIGPVKAERIVEHRRLHGPFGSVEALDAVKGIGPATVARIRDHLRALSSGLPDDRPASPSDGEPAARSREPRSSTEQERATRIAVRRIVDRSLRDARRVESGSTR